MTAGASVRHRRRFVEMWGGEAATWFSGMRAKRARPAGPAQSSVFHNSARRGPTKEAHDGRSISQTDSSMRSGAGAPRRAHSTQGNDGLLPLHSQ